jgi:hypothetical protein
LLIHNGLGKLISSPQCAAAESDSRRRLFVHDPLSKYKFLVDSGAELSILPSADFSKLPRDQFCDLRAANGTRIPTYGEHDLFVSLGLPRRFLHRFLIADVKHAMLGADFLGEHGLLVDIARQRLVDRSSLVSVAAVSLSTDVEGFSIPPCKDLGPRGKLNATFRFRCHRSSDRFIVLSRLRLSALYIHRSMSK